MFRASDIATLLLPGEHTLADPDCIISTLTTDTRQIYDGIALAFIAIRGLRTDGHNYLRQAWERGVRNFIVARDAEIPLLQDSNVYAVNDTVAALQTLAETHRRRFSVPCIGITGSNGKTWVKEWLYQLLAPDHFIVKSPRSFNSQIGVPLSVLQIREEHTLAIFEAGISQTGEMKRIAPLIAPDTGILTHLGDAHQAGFASVEEKLLEKLQLFTTANTIIMPGDESWMTSAAAQLFPGKTLLTWGLKAQDADMPVTTSPSSDQGVTVSYRFRDIAGEYLLPFSDNASINNSITCCLQMLHMGFTPQEIARRMAGLQPVALRLAMRHMPRGSVLINDAYSLDMVSLSVALDSLAHHSKGLSRTLIISDIDHQHAGSYEAMAALIAQKGIDHVIGIGYEVQKIKDALPGDVSFRHFENTHDFLDARAWESPAPSAFLLKGARKFRFEQLGAHMQEQYHSTVLEIDLSALLSNLQFFTSRLNPGTRVIAMVKAAAYGSGGAAIGRFLEAQNISMLAVAYIDEGIDLRKGGVKAPILVMNPDLSRIEQLYTYELEPEIYDFSQLQDIERSGLTDRSLIVHIKVDTGMHRLGFQIEDATRVREWLLSHPWVEVESVFTHLAAAKDRQEQEFTRTQIARFDAFCTVLYDGLGYRPWRHVLNTGGVLNYPEYQYEGVRLGIGLYGTGIRDRTVVLQPVHTLRAQISQIHDISRGETVGYDRAFKADRDMRIGTINIGYADGLRRCAGNERFAVLVHSRPAVILGHVCMDMAMIDLTEQPDVRPGDEAVVFGPGLPVERLAEVCNTTSYEVLTGISSRIARVFVYG